MSIIEEVTESNNTILFIDEIHNIISSGGFGPCASFCLLCRNGQMIHRQLVDLQEKFTQDHLLECCCNAWGGIPPSFGRNTPKDALIVLVAQPNSTSADSRCQTVYTDGSGSLTDPDTPSCDNQTKPSQSETDAPPCSSPRTSAALPSSPSPAHNPGIACSTYPDGD